MQIAQLAAKLQALGLSDKAARIYTAALFLGPSSVQRIAEQAEINRPTAYDILDELMTDGLMSQSTLERKTVYVAEGPEALERWLDNQSRKIIDKKTELKALLPELRQADRTKSGADSAPLVRFFKNEDVIMMNGYLRRKAKPKGVIYSLSNIDDILSQNPDALTSNPVARLKKQISTRLIYSYKDGEVSSDPKLLRKAHKIDEPVAAEINLYESGIDITTYDGGSFNGIIIESPSATKALRQLFELAWANLDQPESSKKRR